MRISLLFAQNRQSSLRISPVVGRLAPSVGQATEVLESAVGEQWTEEQARAAIDGLLLGPGHELSELLWQTVAAKANFAVGPENTRILTTFGRGAEQVVEVVLAEADRPLHYTEIWERATKRTGRNIDVRRAHNAAAEVGLLYGRGTYGLLNTCRSMTRKRQSYSLNLSIFWSKVLKVSSGIVSS